MKKKKVNLGKLSLDKEQVATLSQQTQIAGGATNVSACHPTCLTMNYTICITVCNGNNCA